MARNLIVLSDGTGNSSAKLFKTNVWRLYEALDLDNDDQIAIYDDGVGTSANKYLAAIGGAFGFGLKRNVLRLYRFLCRNYQPGDRVYGFGFSRGAFTIRVLVGLINSQGLIAPKGSGLCHDARKVLWQLRLADRTSGGAIPDLTGLLAAVAAAVRNLPPSDQAKVSAIVDKLPSAADAEAVRYELRRLIDDALILLDDADPSGVVPEDDLTRRASQAYRLYRKIGYKAAWWSLARYGRWIRDGILRLFQEKYDPAQNRVVDGIEFLGLWDTVDAYGLPVDELTDAVHQAIWPLKFDEQKLCPLVKRACHALAIDDERTTFHPVLWDEKDENDAPERIAQVWFSGMHANVGGGYPDDKLSLVPLCWIMDSAGSALVFNGAARQRLKDESTPFGRMYDSRSGFASYYRYGPRPIDALCERAHMKQVRVHETALMRLDAGIDGYGPVALPLDFHVVRATGGTRPLEEYLESQQPPMIVTLPHKTPHAAKCLAFAWDVVWWRRTLTFVSVLLTIWLVLFPTLHSVDADRGWPGSMRLNSELAAEGVLAPLFNLVDGITPGFLAPWLAAYRHYPLLFAGIALALFASSRLSTWLARRILVRARQAWIKNGQREILGSNPFLCIARVARETFLLPVKRHKAARFALALFVYAIVLVTATVLFSRIAFRIENAAGYVCRNTSPVIALAQGFNDREFFTDQVCQATGLTLTQGATYRIEIVSTTGWHDGGIPNVGPEGFRSSLDEPKMFFFVPLRRHLIEPWFRPFARIGALGQEEYPLNARWTEIVPQRTGQLFLYVNDAVFLHPRWPHNFYENNKDGKATVKVTLISPPPRQDIVDPTKPSP